MVVHSMYPDDPMQALCIFCISNASGRYPLGLPASTAEFDRLRRPTNQYYLQYLGRTFKAGSVFHDTMATNISSSMRSLEDVSM